MGTGEGSEHEERRPNRSMSAVLRRTFEGVSIVTDEDPERWSELHAAGNRIEALAPWLASFSRLRVLDLRHNMIESCAGVAACAQLITIDVRDNRLRDGAALVRDLRPLALLQQCDARFNPFSSVWSDVEHMISSSSTPVPQPVQMARMAWRGEMLREHARLSLLDGIAIDSHERTACLAWEQSRCCSSAAPACRGSGAAASSGCTCSCAFASGYSCAAAAATATEPLACAAGHTSFEPSRSLSSGRPDCISSLSSSDSSTVPSATRNA